MSTLFLILAAYAGKCEPEFATSPPGDGAYVRIAGIEKPDPYAASSDALLGRQGRWSARV